MSQALVHEGHSTMQDTAVMPPQHSISTYTLHHVSGHTGPFAHGHLPDVKTAHHIVEDRHGKSFVCKQRPRNNWQGKASLRVTSSSPTNHPMLNTCSSREHSVERTRPACSKASCCNHRSLQIVKGHSANMWQPWGWSFWPYNTWTGWQ